MDKSENLLPPFSLNPIPDVSFYFQKRTKLDTQCVRATACLQTIVYHHTCPKHFALGEVFTKQEVEKFADRFLKLNLSLYLKQNHQENYVKEIKKLEEATEPVVSDSPNS